VDPFPAIGFGLLDSARVRRVAYDVVREAFALTRVIIDPVNFTPMQPWGVAWRPGEDATVRLIVVNDDPRLTGPAQVRWSVWRERPLESGRLGWLRDSLRRKSYSGWTELSLPTAAEPALQLTSLTLPLDAEGDYRLEAELRLPVGPTLRSALIFRVAEDLVTERPRPVLPAYLAERLAIGDSLRPDREGLLFTLRHLTRPAVLTSVGEIRLDGRPLDGVRVLVHTDSGRVPLPRRLELPVGRETNLLVELAHPLEAGEHVLELDVTVPGVASGRVRVRGMVPG
jgi:hypothetical protein